MGSLGVIVLLPFGDDLSGMGQALEPVEVKTFVAESSVEAFDVGILGRLARFDKIEGDLVGVGPGVERVAGEFRSIVDHDAFGTARAGNELVHYALQECWSPRLFRTLWWKSRKLRWTNGGNAPNFFARYVGKLFFRTLAWN
jgi:hypothetical protein